jgi:hypothetical protein
MRVLVGAALIAATLVGAQPAHAQTPPAVSVTAGPTTERLAALDCGDGAYVVDVPSSFVVSRGQSAPTALVVRYSVSPADGPGRRPAVAGVDYAALSGIATIPAGASSVSVPVTALAGPARDVVGIIVTIAPASDYAVVDPMTVDLDLVVEHDAVSSSTSCPANFQLGTGSATAGRGMSVVPAGASAGGGASEGIGELPRTGAPVWRQLLVASLFLAVGTSLLCKARGNAAVHLAHHHRRRVGGRAG